MEFEEGPPPPPRPRRRLHIPTPRPSDPPIKRLTTFDQDIVHEEDIGHGDDRVHEEEQAAGVGGLTEELKCNIVKKAEYYFSDENLPTDEHMISLIRKNKERFVPIGVIASFRKMKKLIKDNVLVAAALKQSNCLVVSSDGKKVRRLHPFPLDAVTDSKLYAVLVENLPEDYSVENLWKMFGEAGNIKHICIRDPHATEESSKGDKAEKFISSKLHALVQYETVEAAEKAVASLNNEQDWRRGMHVKLMKRMDTWRIE